MPIGTIYGFFIGTLIIGVLFAYANNNFRFANHPDRFVQQIVWMLGWALIIVSALTLIGTYIEVGLGS